MCCIKFTYDKLFVQIGFVYYYIGTYTIPDANGDPILVRYKAGPKTGYVVDNLDEVLERTNPQGSSGKILFEMTHQENVYNIFFFSSSTESTADQHQPSYNSNNHETSDGSSEPFFDPLADDNPDRSYQFSYGSNEEDASREEVSDSKGEELRLIFFRPKKIQLGK